MLNVTPLMRRCARHRRGQLARQDPVFCQQMLLQALLQKGAQTLFGREHDFGLWGYIIGDTVRIVDLSPPRILITGRTFYMLSAFGEHLIGEELEDAVTRAAASLGCSVTDFSAGARYPDQSNAKGRHCYVVELLQDTLDPDQIRQFTEAIDRHLSERNEDYAAHRAEGFGMEAPQIVLAGRGCFAACMKSRGRYGGQHKVPRIINDPELFDGLVKFVEKYNKTATAANT